MKRRLYLIGLITFFISNLPLQAQVPTCDSIVPYWFVDMTGTPTYYWSSPTHSRVGHCCSSNTRCTSFEVILDSNAAMIEVGFDTYNDPSQAIPTGSLFYQIGCGPQIPVGDPICITGVGLITLRFVNREIIKTLIIFDPFQGHFSRRMIR